MGREMKTNQMDIYSCAVAEQNSRMCSLSENCRTRAGMNCSFN